MDQSILHGKEQEEAVRTESNRTQYFWKFAWICLICMAGQQQALCLSLTLLQLCLGANEVGERGANEVPKFILPTEPPPPPPPPAPAAQTEPPAPARGPAPWTMANRQHHQQHRHQQHQYYDHPSTTIITNAKTSATSTIVSSSSTTTSTSLTCRNLLCTCQYICARFKIL